MRKPVFRIVTAIVAVLCFASAPAFADGINVDLTCTPLPIANQPADRDPIAQIHGQLDAAQGHFRLNVLHTTLSGQQFWRMDQYTDVGLRHVGPIRDWADVWQWYGGLTRNPDVGMVGYITETRGQYSYMEGVINLKTKAEEMVVHAQCTVAG